MAELIDEIMGFNPQNLEVFNESTGNNYDVNVYKTNPKDSKSDDGQYRSRIRILYNPFDVKRSIVHQATYAMYDSDGFFMVKSKLGDGDKNCPLFKSWKKLWFSGDDNKKNWARQMYDKSESQWVLVQILEDDNKPELTGAIKVMKLPKAIFEKMSDKMNPAPESKKSPVPVMDYLIGLPLEMNVKPGPDDPQNPSRKQREISYTLCEFSSDSEPITKIDGTPLFTGEELELIDTFASTRNDLAKAKTEAKKAEKTKALTAMQDSIKALYVKALDYLKENAINLVDECAFKEWDENTTQRVNNWIEKVANMQDPKTSVTLSTSDKTVEVTPSKSETTVDVTDPFAEIAGGDKKDDDLPF